MTTKQTLTDPSMSMDVEFAGKQWTLLADKALWCPADQTVVMADIHLGKGAAFRAAGLPVPAGSSAKDLDRLSALLQHTNAKRLIILGDFFHAKSGRADEIHSAIAAWRKSHASVEMLLIRGNHDRSSGRVLPDWNIQEIDGIYQEAGLILSHAPLADQSKPVLAGHVHPVFSLRDYDRTSVRVPCFVFDKSCAILPSFGTFTGGHRITQSPERKIYIVAGSKVVRVKSD